jgi:septal ring factor EnvC (AmiA/AmiB activator)
MWADLYGLANTLFNFGKDLKQNRTDIRQLENELKEVADTVEGELRQIRTAIQSLAFELQRLKETEALERDKLALQLEIDVLRGKPMPRSLDQPKVSNTD